MKQRDRLTARLSQAAWMIAGLLTVCCLAGCGGPESGAPASLSGQVTFDGNPVEDGNIRLNVLEGTVGPGGAAKIVNGSYAIPLDSGLTAGQHMVLISAVRSTGKTVEAPDGGGPMEETVSYIPVKYNTRSELRVDLQAGENSEDFALEPGEIAGGEEE